MYSLCLTIVMIIIKCCIIFVAGISVEMFTTASTLFFLIQFVKKKQEIALSQFFICFSKPLYLSLIIFLKKIKIYNPDKIQGQSKGSKVNPINNAPISNLMTNLESLYNFLSE